MQKKSLENCQEKEEFWGKQNNKGKKFSILKKALIRKEKKKGKTTKIYTDKQIKSNNTKKDKESKTDI